MEYSNDIQIITVGNALRRLVSGVGRFKMEFDRLIEEIWKGKQCEECRDIRKEFVEKEKKYHGKYSPTYPGFWYNFPNKPKLPIEVMIITESHGGGHWPDENNVKSVIKDAYNYHKNKPIEKFFQYNIKKILGSLDESNIKWFVTDLIKCFVTKETNKNFRTAINFCKPYLLKQIEILKPKVIIGFGNVVKNSLGEIKDKYKFLSYTFPSSRNADRWVSMGGYEKVVEDIKKEKEETLAKCIDEYNYVKFTLPALEKNRKKKK